MNIEYIKEFVVLTDIGNYEEAAFRLFTTQSTLSKHILSLEHDLGGSALFTRGRSSIELTEYGKKFYLYAERIIELYDGFISSANTLDKDSKTLHLGYAAGMDAYGFFDMIRDFCIRYPDCRVFLEDEMISRKLRTGDIDIGILFEDPGNFDRNSILLLQDRLVPVVPRSHPLAGRSSISMNELKNDDFVMFAPHLFLAAQCTQYCRQNGFNPKIAHTAASSNAELIISLAAHNFGTALIPETEARHCANPDVVILNPDTDYMLNICIQYEKQHSLTQSEMLFTNYIMETLGMRELSAQKEI